MAAAFVTASSQYLKYDSGTILSQPCSMACWFRPTANADAFLMGSVYSGSASNMIGMITASAGTLYARVNGGGTQNAISSANYTLNAWNHACATFAVGSRKIYLNGGNTGTNAGTNDPTVDRFAIGALNGSAVSLAYGGRIAEVAIWNGVALTDDEAAALAKGVSPLLIRPESLTFVSPLMRTLTADIWGGLTLTNVNTATVEDHPPIIMPRSMFARRFTTGSSAPTVSSATIGTTGATLSVVHSASVSIGAGGNGGMAVTASGGAVTATYSSGSGSTTLVYSLSRTLATSETVTIAYTQPGNGIEATTGGADVATYSGQATTNNTVNAPSDLLATAVGTDSINLSWTDNASNETSFELQYDTSVNFNVDPQTISVNTANTTSTSAATLTPNTLYYFRVKAIGSGGASAWSATATATTFSETEPGIATVAGLMGGFGSGFNPVEFD